MTHTTTPVGASGPAAPVSLLISHSPVGLQAPTSFGNFTMMQRKEFKSDLRGKNLV